MERINSKTKVKRLSIEKRGSSKNKNLCKLKKATRTFDVNQSILSKTKNFSPGKKSDNTSFEQVVTADYRQFM